MIFFFSKSRPSLSSMLPQGYVDIHSHLLPGLDDGAKNIGETIALLEGMRRYGFAHCITTPHRLEGVWEYSNQNILDTMAKTREQLPSVLQNKIVRVASEYMLDHSFLKRVHEEELLCLKERYVLVEMSYLAPPAGLHEILYELTLKGYKPVLAHPERYLYLRNTTICEQLKTDGCLFQLNLLSAVGYYGPEVVHFAERLLHNDFIDVVGSDIHHIGHLEALTRPVKLRSLARLEEAMSGNTMFTTAVAGHVL